MADLLVDKTVIVTGALGLLGQTFCHAIAENGAIVVMADIDREKGAGVAEEINRRSGGTGGAWFCHTDITTPESVQELIKAAQKKYGRIDALVNNAYPRNKNYGRKFEQVAMVDFCENVTMHLGGYFLTTQVLAEFFKKQGYGNIITISSVYGLLAPRFEIYQGTEMTMPVEYAVIKAALLNLTRYVAKYYRGHNIRVNSISPGGIYDDQPPLFVERYNACCLSKGMLDKENLVGTLLFLLSEMSEYINGQNLVVDDGFTL